MIRSRGSFRRAAVFVMAGGLGALLATGAYTFLYARGISYLTNDPAACANCHIMTETYDAWVKSTHHAVAVCNDCHAPHDGLLAKLFVKGVNGFNHSVAFTTGRFPDPLRITDLNRSVTESACRSCHGEMTAGIDRHGAVDGDQRMSCIRCHADVGHPD